MNTFWNSFGDVCLLLVLTNKMPHFYGLKSYVLGEIPSLKDRITIVRQLWNLTRDVLVCTSNCWHFFLFLYLQRYMNDFELLFVLYIEKTN